MSAADLLDRALDIAPATVQTDRANSNVAHYVRPASAIDRARIAGTSVRALCGFEWVPTRDPAGLPICNACANILADQILLTEDLV